MKTYHEKLFIKNIKAFQFLLFLFLNFLIDLESRSNFFWSFSLKEKRNIYALRCSWKFFTEILKYDFLKSKDEAFQGHLKAFRKKNPDYEKDF